MSSTSTLQLAGQTDVGRARRDNQDTFICQPLWSDQDALLVVIDGVGGYAGGGQAAELARVAIRQYMATPTGDTLTMLREAVVHANNQIARQRKQDPALSRMCCVLTAAVADTATRKLLYVHVGDTRLYRFRQGQLEKLTHDHSLVGVREDSHQLTEQEAMHHPRRNEILRDVGSMTHRVDDPDFLESGETDLLPGDGLLLCSDGLTDMLTRAEVTAVLTQDSDPDEQITELIRQANEQGGHDNITVVLARLWSSGPAEEPTPPPIRPSRVQTSPPPARPLPNGPAPPRSRVGRIWVILVGVMLVAVLLFRWVQRLVDPLEPRNPNQSGAVVPADSGAVLRESPRDSLRRSPADSSGKPRGNSPAGSRGDSRGINRVPVSADSLRQSR